MTLTELLNSDVRTLGARFAQGWDWWTRELADMTPAVLRPRRRDGVVADAVEGGFDLRRGETLIEPRRAPGRALAAAVMLPPQDVLVRRLTLPRLSGPDLRKLAALELDRFTPFTSEQVLFDVEPLGPAEGGRQIVALGVVRPSRARQTLDEAVALGLRPGRFGARVDGIPRFDFRRGLAALGGGDLGEGRRQTWAWAVLALLVLNLAVLVWRDVEQTRRLRDLVEAQQPGVRAATRLARAAADGRSGRAELLARRDRQEPLRMLDAVNAALPPGQYLTRLEWNGRSLRLAGYKRPDFDVDAALRGSPLLTNPRSMQGGAGPGANELEPFDVVVEPELRRPS